MAKSKHSFARLSYLALALQSSGVVHAALSSTVPSIKTTTFTTTATTTSVITQLVTVTNTLAISLPAVTIYSCPTSNGLGPSSLTTVTTSPKAISPSGLSTTISPTPTTTSTTKATGTSTTTAGLACATGKFGVSKNVVFDQYSTTVDYNSDDMINYLSVNYLAGCLSTCVVSQSCVAITYILTGPGTYMCRLYSSTKRPVAMNSAWNGYSLVKDLSAKACTSPTLS
ncbi:hypothetical protein ANO11243_079070 [Dothideomycetidae sp. 11243]|nr:hypothetical protein ANO11243_079070 [fungal sp. No.11243]